MARANKLKLLADQRGMDVLTMVKEAVEKHGSINGAARALKVRNNSIRHALDQANLRVERQQVVKVVPYDPAV